jgi:hypothetical protein
MSVVAAGVGARFLHARALAAILTILLIPAAVRAGASSPLELRAVKAAKPPVIDGVVGDEEWSGASVASDFVQFEPRRGEPASGRTDVLILYDATHLYVAFRVWDAEPPTAQLTQRDVDLFSDDAVSVLIDSYFDRRSAYYFTTNILGTQADGRVRDPVHLDQVRGG